MNKLKEYRIAAGLTQQFVALSLGVKAPSVNNWESGKSKPKTERLKALAELYGVSVDDLLGEIPEVKGSENNGLPEDLNVTDDYREEQNEIIEMLRRVPKKNYPSLRQYVEFLSNKTDEK